MTGTTVVHTGNYSDDRDVVDRLLLVRFKLSVCRKIKVRSGSYK